MAAERLWTAAHVYYAPPNHALFVDAIVPFIEGTDVSRFFFVRYGENGPHVRLRFLLRDASAVDDFRERLIGHFSGFLAAKPSQRTTEREGWFPNDTIQWVPYEPEIERYGGPNGIDIAEEQFDASSRAALEVIRQADRWTAADGLRTAIAMHVGFARGLSMASAAAAHFFGGLSLEWMRWHPDVKGDVHPDRSRLEALIAGYEERFRELEGTLVSFLRELWDGVERSDPWLARWVADMRRIDGRLDVLRAERPEERRAYRVVAGERVARVWDVLGSYAHMTNNRLAVLNYDEPYVCYLLRRGLECL